MTYTKIAILGITGAGKTTFSRMVQEKTGLPLFHMDALFWRGKWQEVSEQEYLQSHEEILKNNERWIIEGWINPNMADRLKQADLIIYLDYPGWRVAFRYITRYFRHRKVARPELPKESVETFKFRRLFISLFRGERPDIERSLTFAGDTSKIVRLKSPREIHAYLASAFPD